MVCTAQRHCGTSTSMNARSAAATHLKCQRARSNDSPLHVVSRAADDAFHVAPRQGLALPVLAGHFDQQGPRHAGDPAAFAAAAAQPAADAGSRNSMECTALVSRKQQLLRRQPGGGGGGSGISGCISGGGGRDGGQQGNQQKSLLYFQLAGHAQPCGPISLDGLSTASQTV